MELSRVEISSDSRWNCRYILTIDKFAGFPKDIARIVSEYVTQLQYLDWIDQSKINTKFLCENPNAYYAGLVTADDNSIHYAQNPAMRAEILANWNECIKSERIIENPAVFPDVIASGIKFNENWLPFNTHPDAVKLIVEKCLDRLNCQANPQLIEYIRDSTIKLQHGIIAANPAAIDIIQSRLISDGDINWTYLSMNPHPWVIEHLRDHQDEIVWSWFSTNPGIFEYRVDPKLVAELSE
jgi:hypothetical protein